MDETYIGFRTRFLRSAITRPANTTAYAIGDSISAVTTNAGFVFGSIDTNDWSARAHRPGINSLTINALKLHSSANQSTKLAAKLLIFSQTVTAVADNAAFTATDAEMLTLETVINIDPADWVTGNSTSGAEGNAVAEVRNIDVPVSCRTGILYGILVAQNAYTPVSGEILTATLTLTLD
jgi:hypothetical protein